MKGWEASDRDYPVIWPKGAELDRRIDILCAGYVGVRFSGKDRKAQGAQEQWEAVLKDPPHTMLPSGLVGFVGWLMARTPDPLVQTVKLHSDYSPMMLALLKNNCSLDRVENGKGLAGWLIRMGCDNSSFEVCWKAWLARARIEQPEIVAQLPEMLVGKNADDLHTMPNKIVKRVIAMLDLMDGCAQAPIAARAAPRL
jgi:hypothetical protein